MKMNINSNQKNIYKERAERKHGFTLAEVTVVLLILAVIAILTIPVLFQQYQKRQAVVKLKKAYNTISLAIELLRATNKPVAEQTYRGWNRSAAMKFWQDYGFANIKVSKICDGTNIPATACFGASPKTVAGKNFSWYKPGTYFSFILADGTSVSSTFGDGGGYLINFVDTNGLNPPNQLGRDIFRISCDFKDAHPCIITGQQYSREDCLASCSKSNGANNAGMACGGLIVKDSWEIKEDYPW